MTDSGTTGDDVILKAMLLQAESLCRTEDAMLAGQYRFLCDRIRALIELQLCADPEAGKT